MSHELNRPCRFIRAAVVAERSAWVRNMLDSIREIPLTTLDEFIRDPRNVAAAESYLRRGIEALLDLGRHLLSKGFGIAATEYKDIGARLAEVGILSKEQEHLFRQIAGYRNRMAHFYNEIKPEELYMLCTRDIHDLEDLLSALITWLRDHPDKVDQHI
jgi:uncharacterized protein YutE (UPF0331/DUF86 family)